METKVNELALFAGAGGGILGGHLLGWRTVCAVESDPYAASILVSRQNDGTLPTFPIWDDIQTFNGKEWKGIVDIISGGFPCQDISAAGKGAGIKGNRSGLWKEMSRIICEVRPKYVFVENSPLLTSRGLGCVLGDLAELGYDAQWGVLGAKHVGAPHKRTRIWILAYPMCRGFKSNNKQNDTKTENVIPSSAKSFGRWWENEPKLDRVADGVANRVDRIKCIGNGQVPAVAALAFSILKNIK